MRVAVKLFAGLRERAGFGERSLELAAGARVADVWSALSLGDEPPGLLYAVNRSYAEREVELAEGDEVALIPPVSGGDFRLSEEPLDVNAVVREVERNEAGAIATFIGTTRERSRGRDVLYLEYEAYPGMAEKTMAELADELKARYDILDVAIHHRVGRVGIGRALRRHRRLRRPPRRHPRRVPRRDRRPQGLRAALEEGGLRGRRGVDRPGVVEGLLRKTEASEERHALKGLRPGGPATSFAYLAGLVRERSSRPAHRKRRAGSQGVCLLG